MDAPGLQLYPGSSFGPNEFHRVSGCSVAEGRTARHPGAGCPSGEVAVCWDLVKAPRVRTSVLALNPLPTLQSPTPVLKGRAHGCIIVPPQTQNSQSGALGLSF